VLELEFLGRKMKVTVGLEVVKKSIVTKRNRRMHRE